jgi:hypothetical protein
MLSLKYLIENRRNLNLSEIKPTQLGRRLSKAVLMRFLRSARSFRPAKLIPMMFGLGS